MAARSAIAICVLLLSTTPVAANDDGEPAAARADNTTVPDSSVQPARLMRTRPWIHGTMSSEVIDKLEAAIDLANDRVARLPSCAALFTDLGADASETLESVLYLPAPPESEASACRHAMAHTFVGDSRTWVCRSITEISNSQAAMLIIHDALHHAGLSERGRDRRSKTSTDINELVSVRCRL
jgi:hypothetical protein